MIKKVYFIEFDSLCLSEKDLFLKDLFLNLQNNHSTPPYVVNVQDIKNCLKDCIELNDGKKTMNCSGNRFEYYDSDIQYLTELLEKIEDCEFVIVK